MAQFTLNWADGSGVSTGQNAPIRVLVIADDPDAGELLFRLLATQGHHVGVVEEPPQAITVMGNEPPDVTVIDLSRSGPGAGLRVLDTIRRHPSESISEARVIVLGQERSNPVLAWESGADGVLVRPFRATELASEVTAVVHRPEASRRPHRLQQRTGT